MPRNFLKNSSARRVRKIQSLTLDIEGLEHDARRERNIAANMAEKADNIATAALANVGYEKRRMMGHAQGYQKIATQHRKKADKMDKRIAKLKRQRHKLSGD